MILRDNSVDIKCAQSRENNNMQYGNEIRITVCANQGGRKYMEDRVQIECVRKEDGSIDYVYVAVYDGHGGSEASEYVRRHLLENIQRQAGFSGTDNDMLEAMKNGFMETHLAMWKVVDDWPRTASGYTSTAGTTASCAFIRRGKIFTGHVGDSAIILGRKYNDGSIRSESLTIDHKPDSAEEGQRILDAGGMVMEKSGVMRVVWTRPIRGHVGPIRRSTPTESVAFLAIARSLGDLWSYNHDTNQFIVSPQPDVDVIELDSTVQCLVLGSDGLTNVLKPQNIIEIVDKYEKEGADESGRSPNHAGWLLRHALSGWGNLRADNVTVITVMFDDAAAAPAIENYPSDVIMNTDVEMNLEEELTAHQTSMIRITPENTQRLLTVPIELVYTGALDNNFSADSAYSGPGFIQHVKLPSCSVNNRSPSILRRLSEPSFYHSFPSISSISSIFAERARSLQCSIAENPRPCPERSGNDGVESAGSKNELARTSNRRIEDSNMEYRVIESGRRASPFTETFLDRKIFDSRKRRYSPYIVTTIEDCMSSINSAGDDDGFSRPIKYFCHKHSFASSKVKKKDVKSGVCGFEQRYCAPTLSRYLSCDEVDAMKGVENTENEMYKDDGETVSVSTSADQDESTVTQELSIPHDSMVASASCGCHFRNEDSYPVSRTLASAGCRRITALRRTRKEIVSSRIPLSHDQSPVFLTPPRRCQSDNVDESFDALSIHSAKNNTDEDRKLKNASDGCCTRSFFRTKPSGGASALSPTIMLAALRTPHYPVKNTDDPLTRDVSLSSLRATKCHVASSLSSLSPICRLSLRDSSPQPAAGVLLTNGRHCRSVDGLSGVSDSAQKRRITDVTTGDESEPPVKRSRLWGFFASFLGVRR